MTLFFYIIFPDQHEKKNETLPGKARILKGKGGMPEAFKDGTMSKILPSQNQSVPKPASEQACFHESIHISRKSSDSLLVPWMKRR